MASPDESGQAHQPPAAPPPPAPTPPPTATPTGPPPPTGQYYPAYPPPHQIYPMPYGYPMIRHTNAMAIVSLIMIFVFPPLAIVFGFVARSQIQRSGEDGDGMAIAGIAVGIAFTLIWLLVLIFVMIAFVAAIHNAPYQPITSPT